MPRVLATRPLTCVPEVGAVVGDDEDRQVGQRKRQGAEDDRVLRDQDRVDRGEQDADAGDARQQHHGVEAGRPQRLDELAPLPPEVLRDAVAHRQAGLAGGAERGGEEADEHEHEAERARAPSSTGRATWPRVATSMPWGRSTIAAAAAIATESSPPSGKPMKTLARIVRRLLGAPLLLDAAGGEEEHLVRASSRRRRARRRRTSRWPRPRCPARPGGSPR